MNKFVVRDDDERDDQAHATYLEAEDDARQRAAIGSTAVILHGGELVARIGRDHADRVVVDLSSFGCRFI